MIGDSIDAAIEIAAADWIRKISEVHTGVARETCDRTQRYFCQMNKHLTATKTSINN
jgi:hypothetical protein